MRTGGSLRTAIGLLSIDGVVEVQPSDLTEDDAAKAGYSSLSKLLEVLNSRIEGRLYRIEVRFVGADPRIRLRQSDVLSKVEIDGIQHQLEKIDSASRVGNWTSKVLGAIRRHPRVPAAELSMHTGFEKAWLKRSIRRLKELGLTISHETGYELSPRGTSVLKHLEDQGRIDAS